MHLSNLSFSTSHPQHFVCNTPFRIACSCSTLKHALLTRLPTMPNTISESRKICGLLTVRSLHRTVCSRPSRFVQCSVCTVIPHTQTHKLRTTIDRVVRLLILHFYDACKTSARAFRTQRLHTQSDVWTSVVVCKSEHTTPRKSNESWPHWSDTLRHRDTMLHTLNMSFGMLSLGLCLLRAKVSTRSPSRVLLSSSSSALHIFGDERGSRDPRRTHKNADLCARGNIHKQSMLAFIYIWQFLCLCSRDTSTACDFRRISPGAFRTRSSAGVDPRTDSAAAAAAAVQRAAMEKGDGGLLNSCQQKNQRQLRRRWALVDLVEQVSVLRRRLVCARAISTSWIIC